jgi:methionine synthase II (cobalamin-independent)
MITKDTTIEDLVAIKAEAIQYLREKGIRCILCGEPIWGTIEEVSKEKGFSDEEILKMVNELNRLK